MNQIRLFLLVAAAWVLFATVLAAAGMVVWAFAAELLRGLSFIARS